MTTALFLLRTAQLGIPIRDLELLTIGMVTDMLVEAGNDGCEYDFCPPRGTLTHFKEAPNGKKSHPGDHR